MRAAFPLNFRFRITAAVIATVCCAVPVTALRVIGFLLVAGLLPGVALAARSRFRLSATIGLGTALSPVLFGVVSFMAMWAGANAHSAAWIAVGVSLLLFVCCWRSAASQANSTEPTDRRALVGIAILIVLAAVMCFALPLAKLWWRARDDSWFHAAITNKILRDGLPPTDPYFAGLRLQYVYFYHVILGACMSLTRVDALYAMIIVNAIALVSCASAFHALARMFSRRMGPRVAGTALWLFGMNGWFYWFYGLRLVRAFSGETHGAATLKQFFPWSPNGHATAMSLISVEGNQFMFLDKFMLGTAFSLTLSLGASILFLLLTARRGQWSIRHDIALFLAVAGAMLLHPVTGITIAAVTIAVLALLLLVRSQTARGGPSYGRILSCLAAGIAVTIPYVRSVSPARGSGEAMASVAFQPSFAIGLIADLLPALVLALWFLRRPTEHTDSAELLGARPVDSLTLSGSGLLCMWFLFMLIVALTVDLSVNNETKFAFFAWLPLCALATGCFERVWDWRSRRHVAVVLLLSATLPLHMLYFHHAVRDRSTLEIAQAERAAYEWIRHNAPRDAVFIEANDNVRVPVLADRDDYWGTAVYAHNWGYPVAEMSARRELRDHVFSGEGPTDDDVLQLRVLGRPVYVISSANERLQANSRLRGVFTTSQVAVWEVVLAQRP